MLGYVVYLYTMSRTKSTEHSKYVGLLNYKSLRDRGLAGYID